MVKSWIRPWVYVARGSARVQVSSAVGGETLLLDEEVAAGSVFVVPRFAVAFVAAGADGVEWVSLIKSARYVRDMHYVHECCWHTNHAVRACMAGRWWST